MTTKREIERRTKLLTSLRSVYAEQLSRVLDSGRIRKTDITALERAGLLENGIITRQGYSVLYAGDPTEDWPWSTHTTTDEDADAYAYLTAMALLHQDAYSSGWGQYESLRDDGISDPEEILDGLANVCDNYVPRLRKILSSPGWSHKIVDIFPIVAYADDGAKDAFEADFPEY